MMESPSFNMLCQEIEKETKEQVDSILKFTQTKAQEIIDQAEKKAQTLAESILSEAQAKAQAIEKKMLSNINNETKKILLKVSEEIIRDIEQQIKERISDLRNDTISYQKILQGLIIEGILFFEEDSITLICNKNDMPLITEGMLQEIKRYFKKKQKTITIAVDTETHTGLGIILKATGKNVIWDNTLEKRIKLLEEEIRNIIITEVFS